MEIKATSISSHLRKKSKLCFWHEYWCILHFQELHKRVEVFFRFWSFGLSPFRFVDILFVDGSVCRSFGLWMFCFLDALVCEIFGFAMFLVSLRSGVLTFQSIGFLVVDFPVCRRLSAICFGLNEYHYRKFRADSRLAPSQWETLLQSNTVSHWLGLNLESALKLLWRFATGARTSIRIHLRLKNYVRVSSSVKCHVPRVIWRIMFTSLTSIYAYRWASARKT